MTSHERALTICLIVLVLTGGIRLTFLEITVRRLTKNQSELASTLLHAVESNKRTLDLTETLQGQLKSVLDGPLASINKTESLTREAIDFHTKAITQLAENQSKMVPGA